MDQKMTTPDEELAKLDREWMVVQGRDPETLAIAESIKQQIADAKLRPANVLAALLESMKTPAYELELTSNRMWGHHILTHAVPSLERIYLELVKRGHNKDNPFDFNDFDDHIWYEKAPNNQRVIVHQMQSVNWLYVWDANLATDGRYGHFHVRQWWAQYVPAKDETDELEREWAAEDEEQYRKNGILLAIQNADDLAQRWSDYLGTYPRRPSLEMYRTKDFAPEYGDFRDPGYILSYERFSDEIELSSHSHRQLDLLCTCFLPSMVCALFEDDEDASKL